MALIITIAVSGAILVVSYGAANPKTVVGKYWDAIVNHFFGKEGDSSTDKLGSFNSRIKGHVYKPDSSPVKDVRVILSINGINSQTTQPNGGFDFTIANSEIPDTVLISVWSNKFGFINQ